VPARAARDARAGVGTIVNIGSMGGRLTFPGAGVYHSTKYALESIADSLRFELRGFGIDVVLIEPGLIVTGFGPAQGHPRPTLGPDHARGIPDTPQMTRAV